MTTLNQAAYNILNQLRGGRSSNNEHLSLEQIKYWIKYYRALLIRRDEENLSRIEELTQTIVVDMSAANETWATTNGFVFPAAGSNVPPTVVKSTATLPRIVRLKNRPAIQHVWNQDSLAEIQQIDIRRSVWTQYDKYVSSTRRYWYNKGFLWISNWDVSVVVDPDCIVQAVFEDPETAYNYALQGQDPWDDDVNEFPISADLLQQVTQSIINGEARVMVSSPTDITTDNLPDRQE